jgi:hypothetical protein
MQREYTLKGLVDKIEYPTLVCDNAADAIAGGQAKRLYDALGCPKDYVRFTAEEGADGHCEGGRRFSSTASPTTGWIRGWRLRRRRTRSPATRTSENAVKAKFTASSCRKGSYSTSVT